MDVLLSAVASDLVGRLFSFLIGKYQERRGTTDSAVRLQRALLRARVVVEEAEGRQITNQAMLQQLNQLKHELCRAAYAIDAFRWRDRRSHARVSQYRSHCPPLSSNCPDVLPIMAQSLEAALIDMREFVVLLKSCPRITKQPYNTYLFMENCMFGRQLEKEQIISFLLQPSHQDLGVLPIIGPHEIGKRTLVEHVCLDERVRERFAKIHRLSSDELDDLQSADHHWSLFDFTAKSLMVIDMVDSDVDAEESWRKFCSAIRRRAHNESKIIVISRTEAHSNMGTVLPLRLHPPSREEIWYFFRILAFGVADPDDYPDLACIAMAVCSGISSDFAPFVVSNIIAASLRANLNARPWHRVRKIGAKAMTLQLDAGHCYPCWPLKDPGVPCFFYNRRKLTSVARNELPKVTMSELITAEASLPHAEAVGETGFHMLVWQSRIPPYASYVATCDMERAQQLVVGENQARKRRRDQL